MPWNELLNNKEMTDSLYLMKKLMEIRSSYKELSNEKVSFIKSNKRLLHYLRPLLNGTLEVFVNEDKTDEMIVTSQESRILFESRYENRTTLLPFIIIRSYLLFQSLTEICFFRLPETTKYDSTES
ncbi:hypothetical protein [Succinivibrio dextrinosolvens]|uniref:hypothetical protein n=1 Tax=Succinivibrio dextrinosolvens TaxID=83771 RepID=UPI00241E7F66|nr:hypothetical protein [Succinivibrio dextrinosolvens]MBE6422922.1 hypothetical protein [Succinivibrio dextrinosolvens]